MPPHSQQLSGGFNYKIMPQGIFKNPEERKRKISLAMKGQIPWNKGKIGIYSEKTLKKMSESLKGRIAWNKGKKLHYQNKWGHHTEEARRKMSEANKRRYAKGEKFGFQKKEEHWNWKDGATPKNKLLRSSADFKHWREKVFKKDNYTCWICEMKGYLHPHHLKRFADYSNLRFKTSNGLTLCEFCHRTYTDFGR